eukprot:RCo042713
MGSCLTSPTASPEGDDEILEFTEADIADTYEFIFENIERAAKELFEAEVLTRQQLTPPSDVLLHGLGAVAALNLVLAQAAYSSTGVVVRNRHLNGKNSPQHFQSLVLAVIELKEHHKKLADLGRELSVGELSKVKERLVQYTGDGPVKSWGTALQRYEALIFYCNAVARAIDALPRFPEFKQKTAAKIEEMARNSEVSTLVVTFVPERQSTVADEEEEDPPAGPRVMAMPFTVKENRSPHPHQSYVAVVDSPSGGDLLRVDSFDDA